MSISFSCPRCSASYRVSAEYAGKNTKCKKCGETLSVPEVHAKTAPDEDVPPERRPRPTSTRRSSRPSSSDGGGPRRRRGEPAEPVEPALPGAAVGLCAAAAVGGAAAWAALALFAHYEHAVLAWAIGGACGGAMVKLGGRGSIAAGLAAGLAVLGIVGGKVVAAMVMIDHAVDQVAESPELRQRFEEDRDFGKVVKEMEHPLKLADVRELTEQLGIEGSGEGGELTALEVTEARKDLIFCESLAESDGWSRYQARYRESIQMDVGIATVLKEETAPVDLLFLVLGVGTAFGLVKRES